MKHALKNFTSGSQLLENFTLMFAAGFRTPAWLLLASLFFVFWVHWSLWLTDHSQYLALMNLQAIAYGWMKFDQTKAVVLESMSGFNVTLTWGTIRDYPPMLYAWEEFRNVVISAVFWTCVVFVPGMMGYFWYATRFGQKARSNKHLAGARLADLPELKRQIRTRNSTERAREMKAVFGPFWWFRTLTIKDHEWNATGLYRPYEIAGVEFPYHLEQSHAMLAGTTGTGKTLVLSDIVAQIRERNHRAVIFDLTGSFIERFYDETRDVILNPIDARCPPWSVFNECDTEAEFVTAWDALIPHDGGGDDPFWVKAARMLGVEISMKLAKEGRQSNEALYKE